jgi:nitrate/nitrite transport system permease protein
MATTVPWWRAAVLSLLLLAFLLLGWELAVKGGGGPAGPAVDPELAALLSPAAAAGGQTAMPAPSEIGARLVELLSDPFHRRGTNDQGIGIQIAYSLGRVAAGFLLAAAVAIPLGFLIGMSPLLNAALNPFVQVLRPVSPLAWMPLALYTIRDSSVSSIFVIFICSLWPMLINTAFGVATVRREWLNVARTLEAGRWRTATRVILPAAAPTILTGMRISIGIAWLVIVAAEMLVGGTGIGYWVWNQWNNLSIADIVIAILMIGIVGLLLDRMLGLVQRWVAWQE